VNHVVWVLNSFDFFANNAIIRALTNNFGFKTRLNLIKFKRVFFAKKRKMRRSFDPKFISKNKKHPKMRLLFQILLLFLLGCNPAEPSHRPAEQAPNRDNSTQKPGQSASKNNRNIPKNVFDVLSFVRDNGQAPDGFVGGRTFQNRENRLEKTTPDGRKIKYREWDVFPKTQGKNRGTHRLITGDDGSAWYTSDHYKTFKSVDNQ
jgi:ribonuclease T1